MGGLLADGVYDAEVLCNECVEIPVPNHTVATWLLPNTLTVWEEAPYVLGKVSPDRRRAIAAEILRIKEAGDTRVANTWKMRRIVLILLRPSVFR